MKYGDKFFRTGGSTIVSKDNIDDLIFDQIEEIKEIQNYYDQTEEIKITIKALREELARLRDLKNRTPSAQLDLFPEWAPEMEAIS